MEEIKICPFCGKIPEVEERSDSNQVICWKVKCTNHGICYCAPEGNWCDSKEYAIKRWNTRNNSV